MRNVAVHRFLRTKNLADFGAWIQAVIDSSNGGGVCANTTGAAATQCRQNALSQLDETEAFCQIATLPAGECAIAFFEKVPSATPEPFPCELQSSDTWCADRFSRGNCVLATGAGGKYNYKDDKFASARARALILGAPLDNCVHSSSQCLAPPNDRYIFS